MSPLFINRSVKGIQKGHLEHSPKIPRAAQVTHGEKKSQQGTVYYKLPWRREADTQKMIKIVSVKFVMETKEKQKRLV